MKNHKVVVLTDIMAPYRIPVFNELAKQTDFDFHVIFFAEMAGDRKWEVHKETMQFNYRIVPGIGIPLRDRFPAFLTPGLFQTLCELKPDVIICSGYHHPSFLIAALYARCFRKKLILWSETHAQSLRIRHSLAMFYRKLAILHCSAYLVPGSLAHAFISSFNVNGKPIYVAPNVVDNQFFSNASIKFSEQKERYKIAWGAPKRVVLYVGRLVPHKGLQVLFEAFGRLNDAETALVIVGSGPEEMTYRRYCSTRGFKNVFFEGFKQQCDLPFYYGLADVLVLPSFREEWGLVLNEAMASRLPVIASDAVGAAWDLIEPGVNGYRFPTGNVQELQRCLDQILGNDQLRQNMGQSSYQMVQQFSPEKCAERFAKAILGNRI